MTAPIPSPVALRHEGRVFLLSLLHIRVVCGAPIDAESWQDAYDQAVSYQTVFDARRELAGVTS